MVTGDVNQTMIFIGILVAIFGGVAAAFFIMSRSRQRKEAAKY
jgi:H+/gluconate symporter-like permease